MQYNSDLKQILTKYKRMPAGTIEETMESVTSTNQPVYVFDNTTAPTAIDRLSSNVVRGDISLMIENVQDLAREYLLMKKDLKMQTEQNLFIEKLTYTLKTEKYARQKEREMHA